MSEARSGNFSKYIVLMPDIVVPAEEQAIVSVLKRCFSIKPGSRVLALEFSISMKRFEFNEILGLSTVHCGFYTDEVRSTLIES